MKTSARVKEQIIELLGSAAYKEDAPDTKFIASRVFSSADELQQLNMIIHPAVALDFKTWIKNQTTSYIIYEAAILFESGGYKKCDASILVTAPYEKRITRIKARDNSSEADIEARMQHQWDDEKKRKLANYEIKNTELSSTREQVRNLHEILLNPSKN
ncbi:dephospho-CoA kinase [Antarcticibacterium sp. 1MA-6-2]|uniref:dephospho-CoA kinase n=1 Tax=Antarcticibacterium sp. 1MA-6-2 TaxID=2908210 RepID=UPI001EEBF98F|nr:dephospho-CoA kinase [Antarcticibacterium sp. 1MA-6-2]UJH91190.1 dephospho-CoA kinase [Antarcticibacterium sp. 1MA-6-2]